MGLNERQIDIIANATAKKDYYLTSPMGARLFSLALGPIALALCGSGSVDDQKLLAKIKSSGVSELFSEFIKEKAGGADESNF
jgi:type IV secretion system protein VirB4